MSEYAIKKSKRPEILVVAHAPQTREQLGAILSNQGFHISHASDYAGALHSAGSSLPDLILADLHLKEMKGFEACRLLKSEERVKDVPIILFNAAGRKEEIKESFEAGCADYIAAPFAPEEVLARVKALLAARQQEKRRLRKVESRADELARSLEREQAANALFMESLERVDRVIRGETRVNKMLDQAIETVLDIFDCDRAWLLFPCDPSSDTWSIPIERTRPEYPGAFALNSKFPMTPDAADAMEEVLAVDEPISGVLSPREPLWDPEDMYGVRSYLLMAIRPKTGKPWEFGLHQCSRSREWSDDEIRLFKKIGHRIGDALSTLLVLRDLEKSKAHHLSHIRFLESLERIDGAIHKARDLPGMLKDVIQVVFSEFDCDRSWLMYPCDPDADTYRIPMEITKPEYPGANILDQDIPMKPVGDKVCSATLAADAPVTYGPRGDHAVPPELTEQFGVQAQMTLAVFPRIGKPWIFGMHQCAYARVYTEQEKSLFKEIGRRVADGLSSMLLFRDLKESEEKLASTLESLDDLVLVLDTRGIFRDFHLPSDKADLLVHQEEFLGKSLREVMPPRLLPLFEAAFNTVMETGEVQQFDYHLDLSGVLRWFSAKFSIRRDASGECAGVTVVCREITSRKLAEEALRDNEERYRAAIENSSDGIAMSESGNFLFVNKRMLKIFEYDRPEELVGKPISTIVHPDDRNRISRYARLREKGQPVPERYEAKGVTKMGRSVHFDLSVTRITYRDQKVSLLFLEDITQQRELETQLAQAQKMEAIGTLAGGIAHDFNNILGAILGRAELALLPNMKEADIQRHLKEILLSGSRATELVRQILAFSRRKDLGRKPLKLSLLIDENLKILRPSLPSTIRITKRFEDRDGMIMANATQMHQVLMNLGTNAAHAMGGKGGELCVSLKNETLDSAGGSVSPALKPGEYVKLSVSDNGHGMDRSMLERIFDPYFSTKKQGEGTGLGLSVVHSIIKSSGGEISVKSTPGRGTTFHIFLPRIEPTKTAPPKVLPDGGFISGRGRILFVDDEEALISIGKDILEFLGYHVTAVTSSKEALTLFKKTPARFDMVITDLTMPDLTGDALSKRLLKVRPDIPIILCTGYGDMLTRTQAESMGIRKFLLKPLSMDQLSGAIREVLEGEKAPSPDKPEPEPF